MNVADFFWKDLETREKLHIGIRASPGQVYWGVLGERGDIEVAFGPPECEKIVILLERASLHETDYIMAHRFENLDGGAEANVLVWRKDGGVEITLDRSDEGIKRFRVPHIEVGTLVDALKRAVPIASSSSKNSR